jgi:hypothetical protein
MPIDLGTSTSACARLFIRTQEFKQALQSKDSNRYRSAWRLPPDDHSRDKQKMLVRLGEFLQLLELAEAEVNKYELESVFQRSFAIAKSHLSNVQESDHGREVFRSLSEEKLLGLEFVATEVARAANSYSPAIAVLDEITSELAALSDELRRSSLPDDLRQFLVEGIEDLRSACVSYHFVGQDAIHKSVDQLVGGVIRRKATYEASATDPILQRLWRAIGKAETFTSLTHNLTNLLPAASAVVAAISGSTK